MTKKIPLSRKSNLSTLSESLQDLLQAYRIESKFDATKLTSSWERLMGAPISKRTRRLFIKKRILYVEVSSAALKHELTLSKHKILDIFYKEFGKKMLDDIIFI